MEPNLPRNTTNADAEEQKRRKLVLFLVSFVLFLTILGWLDPGNKITLWIALVAIAGLAIDAWRLKHTWSAILYTAILGYLFVKGILSEL